MKSFKDYLAEAHYRDWRENYDSWLAQNQRSAALDEGTKNELEPHPLDKMRDHDEKELDWEYGNEYTKYHKHIFPHAFKSREEFGQKYAAAPVRHLTAHELKRLDYATVDHIINHRSNDVEARMATVHGDIGHRRDVHKIRAGIEGGKIPHPIVFKKNLPGGDYRLRIMGGNSRMMTGAALKKNVPVKLIDV